MHESLALNRRKAWLGFLAVFFTQLISFMFINGRNIAQPAMVNEFNGMPLYSWLIALPALSGAIGTLLFGKLSDIYGRRTMLLVSVGIFVVGLYLVTRSMSMWSLIGAQTFMSFGHFPIVPLCFASLADLFPSDERASWTGYLNIATVLAAIFGPTLGGILTESNLGWRALNWSAIPAMLVAMAVLLMAMPGHHHKVSRKVDIIGTVVMAIATMSLIVGMTLIGDPAYRVIGWGALAVSLVAWVAFVRVEGQVESPVLDLMVMKNRVFMTASIASLLAFVSMVGIMAYAPIFVERIMHASPTESGSMLTPYVLIFAVMGILSGLLLARTGKYRWIYNISYSVATIALVAMWQFTALTPSWWFVLVTALAGFGMGSAGTINTLVAQYALPSRLVGVAVAAMSFFQMVGIAVSPSVLGIVLNSAPTLEAGLKMVFFVSAISMALATVLILTIPEIAPSGTGAQQS